MHSRYVAFFALAFPPLYFFFDTLLALRAGWPYRPSTGLILGFLAIGFVIPFLLMIGRNTRLWFTLHAGQIVLASFCLWLCLAMGEFILSFLLPPERFHLASPGFQYIFRPDPAILPGIEGEGRYAVNSLGVRGSEPPPRELAYRILCIGGSTTECTYLDDEETWPSLLMRRLNEAQSNQRFWVGNAGRSGYPAGWHLRLLECERFLRHFDCLVFLVGINDFLHGLRGQSLAKDLNRPSWMKFRWVEEWRALLFTPNYERKGIAMDATGHSCYPVWRQRRKTSILLDTLPSLEGALEEYRAVLSAILDRRQTLRLRAVFLTQPVVWSFSLSKKAEDLCWIGTDGTHYFTVSSLRRGIDRFNDVLIRVVEERGAEWVDLRGMNGKEAYFYDDCHFNEAGAREVARLTAEHFLRYLTRARH